MKTFLKVLLLILSAEPSAGRMGVDTCPDPAMLKSIARLITEEAAIDPMVSYVTLFFIWTR